MTFLFFAIGILQCVFFGLLYARGDRRNYEARAEEAQSRLEPPQGWPRLALIIPMAGADPRMREAVTSLLRQDYPHYEAILVTAGAEEPAGQLAEELAAEFPQASHVCAGPAKGCGQKNHNLLCGVAAAGPDAQLYAFSDSTHLARTDFLRCLVEPIVRGAADFSTGYHTVRPGDERLPTLAYAFCVQFMGYLQAMPSLCQPWGGAMAMSRGAFERCQIASLWARTVVDDCSLAAWLRERDMRAIFSPGAMLITPLRNMDAPRWLAWLRRQLLFLKFCMPGQWLGLGLASIFLLLPPLWALLALIFAATGYAGSLPPLLALVWASVLCAFIGPWRTAIGCPNTGLARWLCAFFLACGGFGLVYVISIFDRTITWHGLVYRVGARGVVRGMNAKS